MLSLAHINQSVTDLQTLIFSKLVDESISFDEMTKLTEKGLNKLIIEMLQSILIDMEETIRDSSDRKQKYWVHRSDDHKVIATNFGDVEYSRAYYRDKTTKEFTYLLDDMLDIAPHQRLDGNLESRILDNAKDMSYQKAINKIPNISVHSKQTTYNIVHKLAKSNLELPIEEVTEKKTPKYLYIEADEDHVAMQDSPNKQMKLVYIHTGFNYEKSTEKGNVLNMERIFSGWYPNNDELWLEVSAYIEETFNTKNISQVFLSGDGAGWIKSGIDYLPSNTTFVLDRFHVKQSILRSVVGLGPKAKETMGLLRRWIAFDQKEKVKLYFETRLLDPDLSFSAKKSLNDNKKYLLNNWTSIQNQSALGYITCSAEGHVSHILSSRLSSRPLGWSKNGAEIIAKLRVYTLNGGRTDQLIEDIKHQSRRERKIIQIEKRISKDKKREYTSISYGSIPNYGSSSSPIGVLKRKFN